MESAILGLQMNTGVKLQTAESNPATALAVVVVVFCPPRNDAGRMVFSVAGATVTSTKRASVRSAVTKLASITELSFAGNALRNRT